MSSAQPTPPTDSLTDTAGPAVACTIRNAILCLSLASFASGASLRVSDSLLPRLVSDFQISLGTASYTITAFAIAYGLAQVLFGPLGDRFGKYLVIAMVCAASVLSALMCALAPTFPMLVMARLLAGACAAAVIPLAMAWIGDVVPYEQRQPVLARFLAGQILGVSSGVLIGGLAADHFGWRPPFFIIAALFAIASATLFWLNRKLPDSARQTRSLLASDGWVIGRMLSEFRHVLAVPWARVVLLTVFLEGLFVFGAFAFITSHLHHTFGLSLTMAGSLLMLFGLGGLSFAMFSAPLVRRLGEIGLARWGGGLACAALLCIGIAPSWVWALPGCFITGLGYYMIHNTLQINATQMAPERRGAAVSSFASSFFLGQSVGVALAAWLIDWIGTGAVIAAFSVGLFAVSWDFGRRKERHLCSLHPG
ncbi:MFS transporter [Lacisediminimonas sp.]|uniref:MFS transporter n=1 Tax=Lacisediminimonas sp. TaxID=3060582 RepID=UPI0027266496|nr:MFS transporter [Lacisediminimonas sp.]MDO8298386.1 MFS transporter [Lacisediminimonas sp.]MDO9216604.1 MFS transporter [Lacisediminimonas sp.]